MNFAKFLRTPLLTKHLQWLLPKQFFGLIHDVTFFQIHVSKSYNDAILLKCNKKELCINERIQNPVKHLAGSDILIEILEKHSIFRLTVLVTLVL